MEEMDREFFKKYHRAVVKANAKEVEKVKSRIGSVWAEEFRARTGTRLEGEAFNQARMQAARRQDTGAAGCTAAMGVIGAVDGVPWCNAALPAPALEVLLAGVWERLVIGSGGRLPKNGGCIDIKVPSRNVRTDTSPASL